MEVPDGTKLRILGLCLHAEPEGQSKAKTRRTWKEFLNVCFCQFPCAFTGEELQIMVNTQSPSLVLHKRKIILAGIIRSLRCTTRKAGNFTSHPAHNGQSEGTMSLLFGVLSS